MHSCDVSNQLSSGGFGITSSVTTSTPNQLLMAAGVTEWDIPLLQYWAIDSPF